MDPEFWHAKWQKNEIAFHDSKANPFLVKYFKQLGLSRGKRIFLPLCGKTLDIAWLLSAGYRVVGAELSETAVTQLFAELGIKPRITVAGKLTHYGAPDIDIFVGDIFALDANLLGTVDAIYDRAALVALPEEMRNRYTRHLREITGNAPQLLITYEYDQNLTPGPPFSISAAEVRRHYDADYKLTLLEEAEVGGGLRGKVPAHENIWILNSQV